MQFSTSKEPQTQINQTWWEKFKSQPHQLFFTSTIFFAISIMLISLFSLLGKVNLDFSMIHGFGLNFGVFANAFLGFLITVIPKYNGSSIIEENQYIKGWISFQLGLLIGLFINAMLGKFIVSITMFYFVYVFYQKIKEGKSLEKKDSIYINSIFALGAFLLFIDALITTNLSVLIFYAFLLTTVFLVALRMIPAFYFAFTRIPPWQRPEYVKPVSVALFILTGIFSQFEVLTALKLISFISVAFFGYILFKLNLYKKTPAILSILTFSLLWLEIGFIFLFIESIFELQTFKLSFHIFALGFITSLLIGFGSRVALGHAVPAQAIQADKITKFLFIFTQIVVLSRIIASVLFTLEIPMFMGIVHLSATLWILLFVVWTFRYGKILLRIN